VIASVRYCELIEENVYTRVCVALHPIAFNNHDMITTFDMQHWQQELTAALPLLGAVFGCLLVLLGTGDYISRRGILSLSAAMYIGGCLFVGTYRS